MAKEKNNKEKNKKKTKVETAKKKRKLWPILTVLVLLLLAAASGYYFFAPPSWPYSAKALREQKERQTEQQERSLAQENADLRAELSALESEKRQLESQLDQLNRRLAERQSQLEQKQLAEQEEAYRRLRATAQLFSDMAPSKAVAILQAMPRHEAALILKAMDEKDRGRVLSRFDPETAAALALALQQVPPLDETSDLEGIREQLAAALPQPPSASAAPEVTAEEMAVTLSAMDASAAAEMLAQWWSQDRQGTLAILHAMTPESRAQLLAELEADVATEMGRQLVRDAS
jgi:flagellar motility protein MotE (MotC chaperone)